MKKGSVKILFFDSVPIENNIFHYFMLKLVLEKIVYIYLD